jgi:hypothetical protein
MSTICTSACLLAFMCTTACTAPNGEQNRRMSSCYAPQPRITETHMHGRYRSSWRYSGAKWKPATLTSDASSSIFRMCNTRLLRTPGSEAAAIKSTYQ